jgi:hypothetical protein
LRYSSCWWRPWGATPAGAKGKPGYACPPGFNIGAVTPEGALALERSQAAIEAGLFTEEDLLAAYRALDANGSGYICASLPHGFEVSNRPNGQYFYNFADDNASVPSG